MRPVAPLIFVIVSAWMIAAAVMAVRQALDYRSTVRAIAVSVVAFLVSAGMLVAIAFTFTARVSSS
jgi:hypothetical protein